MASTKVTSACDACRRRKVKCDLADPCSNCRISGLQCQCTLTPKKRGRKTRKPSALPTTPSTQFRLAASQQPQSGASPEPAAAIPSYDSPASSVMLGQSPSIHTSESARVFIALVDAISSAFPSTIEEVIPNCIELYIQYLFPIQPLVHEPTIRASASLFSPQASSNHAAWPVADPSSDGDFSLLKSFTLVTALCAFVTSTAPDSLLPGAHLLASPFLKASQAMLQLYLDYDLENPDSSSLNIRMWHSASRQNITGRVGASWHYHGEATLIAQRLRLYSEEWVSQSPPIEAQVLRAGFWHLYAAERTAEALESRPVVLHETLFHSELTVREHTEQDQLLLDVSQGHHQQSLELRLRVGFHIKCRVWILAARLTSGIKAYARRLRNDAIDTGADAEVSRLTDLYISFLTTADDLPEFLWSLDSVDDQIMDKEVLVYQRTCFMVQRSNIMTTFHCMKLVALQLCITHNLVQIMGLTPDTTSFALRKLEIASEFIRELRLVPFACLKMQGETAVEKIRRVAASLLELIQTMDHSGIKARASSQFERILDYLSELDSKASDELSSNYVR
ncbi:hypothetical protein BJY04DRAFT_223105 [Aspergillus karnatakaensis]|uniref:uncharacterized protein n=1 Tax=Aspergillus karnatakaensis TaxID=1810916 RepID=UPI003CCDD898